MRGDAIPSASWLGCAHRVPHGASQSNALKFCCPVFSVMPLSTVMVFFEPRPVALTILALGKNGIGCDPRRSF